MPRKDTTGSFVTPKIVTPLFGSSDKIISSIFGGVLFFLLLWIGTQTHQNTVLLAEVNATLNSAIKMSEHNSRTVNHRIDKLESHLMERR